METLIECKNLSKEFTLKESSGVFAQKETVHAVSDVSLSINKGKTLGLVGESGCGKSTLGILLLRLINPTSGVIRYAGKTISEIDGPELRRLRRNFQIIFQDPYSSLNPRMTVEQIVTEPLIIHKLYQNKIERQARSKELLDLVGLPSDAAQKYPHQFSGGQRQRIGIARALAVRPEFIVCDEPVSALDVSIQAQIVNLLMDLQSEFNLTYLFIAHDLHIVEHISDEIAIMYLGKIIEQGPANTVFSKPRHPYTEALLSASPVPDPKARRQRILLKGDIPSPIDLPTGCHFHPRCHHAQAECSENLPSLNHNDNHQFACWHPTN